LEYLEVNKQEQLEYLCTLTYLDIPGNNDARHVRIILEASDPVQAMVRAMNMDIANKAEMMTDFINPYPPKLGENTFTREEIEDIRQQAIDSGLFQDWLIGNKPTAIQVVESNSVERVNDIAIDEVIEHASHIGNQAEDFLKEQDNNNDNKKGDDNDE
tara:strand:- start:3333 stop:3806 length:474 start_codon:yes stop_codon:yes gene_type:complete